MIKILILGALVFLGCQRLGDTRKNESKEVVLLQKDCDSGDTWGCYNLGVMYKDGKGVTQNYRKAAELFQKSCSSRNVSGCARLFVMYYKGTGVPQNFEIAAGLLQKVCNGGYATGCNRLGLMYYKGEGVTQNYLKAAELYQKACDKGYAMGCFNAGIMYYKGEGVLRGKLIAAKLFQKACDLGYAKGCFGLGEMYSKGEGVTQNKLIAAKLYQKACDKGYTGGCSILRKINKEGKELSKELDGVRGIKWGTHYSKIEGLVLKDRSSRSGSIYTRFEGDNWLGVPIEPITYGFDEKGFLIMVILSTPKGLTDVQLDEFYLNCERTFGKPHKIEDKDMGRGVVFRTRTWYGQITTIGAISMGFFEKSWMLTFRPSSDADRKMLVTIKEQQQLEMKRQEELEKEAALKRALEEKKRQIEAEKNRKRRREELNEMKKVHIRHCNNVKNKIWIGLGVFLAGVALFAPGMAMMILGSHKTTTVTDSGPVTKNEFDAIGYGGLGLVIPGAIALVGGIYTMAHYRGSSLYRIYCK